MGLVPIEEESRTGNRCVLEDGEWKRMQEGTPQGGSASPLLANIYLHYTLDLWIQSWRRKRTGEDVIFVRYADYGVVGFQKKSTAKQFCEELKQRMQKFGLELHPEKTHLLEFGRYAAERRRERGQGMDSLRFCGRRFASECRQS
jgi:hypothetical protein